MGTAAVGSAIRIDEASPVPRYYQLVRILEDELNSGRLHPGDRFHSERDLAKRSGLSVMTVRQALAELVRRGRLQREQGRGSFVCESRSPRTSAQPKIALVLFELTGDLSAGYWYILAGTMAGVGDVLRRAGCELAVHDVEGDAKPAIEARVFDPSAGYSGLIVTEPIARARTFMVRAANQGMPIVCIGDPVRLPSPVPDGVHMVYPDTRAGGRLAGEALGRRGHRRAAFLGPVSERCYGFREGLESCGGKLDDGMIVDDKAGTLIECERAGYASVARLIAEGRLPSALFAANDCRAFGAMRALADRGIRVPEDVSVVGFDDLPECAAMSPPLASVRLPHLEAGQEAARALLAWLAERDGFRPSVSPVAPALIERGSLGAASPG